MTNSVTKQLDWDVFLGNLWRARDVLRGPAYRRTVDYRDDIIPSAVWCGFDAHTFQNLFRRNVTR